MNTALIFHHILTCDPRNFPGTTPASNSYRTLKEFPAMQKNRDAKFVELVFEIPRKAMKVM